MKRLSSTCVFLVGFLVLGAAYVAFEIYVVGHYPRFGGPSFAFEVALLLVLGGGAFAALLFAAFCALLRASPSLLTSVLLGALSWALIYGSGVALGGVAIPSTAAFLLLLGSSFISAALGRVSVAQRTHGRAAG